ncbi:hypothetical protein EV424DRAFT_1532625 [Suillus variegatus]|nr:hypothetical protein EV424DRAFT_1532625 [Suillus variegatus]
MHPHAQMAMAHAPQEDHSHLTRQPSSVAYLSRQPSAAGYPIPNDPQAHYVNLDRFSVTPFQFADISRQLGSDSHSTMAPSKRLTISLIWRINSQPMSHDLRLPQLALTGAGAGAITSFIPTPVKLVKCKMQEQMIAPGLLSALIHESTAAAALNSCLEPISRPVPGPTAILRRQVSSSSTGVHFVLVQTLLLNVLAAHKRVSPFQRDMSSPPNSPQAVGT